MSPSNLPWASVLEKAAEQLDGGARSFPLALDGTFSRRYAYEAPNERYQKLFFRQATVSNSQQDAVFDGHSAGWLIPNDGSDCNPIFIAHSTQSAIWLLREILPEDTLSNNAWERLVRAAQLLAISQEEEPPSAQESPPIQTASFAPRARLKRSRPSIELEDEHMLKDHDTMDSDPDDAPLHQDMLSPNRPGNSRQTSESRSLVPFTTVTNNNRRAEQARKKKMEATRLKRRNDIGLIAPTTIEDTVAYNAIQVEDELIISWIFKQRIEKDLDFYTRAEFPYVTACSMLEKARALGDLSAQYNTASFLQCWRLRGAPFRIHNNVVGVYSSNSTRNNTYRLNRRPASTQLESPVASFSYAWELCNHYEKELAAVHVEYRWVMALLGRAYFEEIARIKQDDLRIARDRSQKSHNKGNRNRHGRGKVSSEAKKKLLYLVSPQATPSDELIFTRRLACASRWYEAASTLGWGCFCLMSHQRITNRWIEKDLRMAELRLWLSLVKKVNPDAYAASKKMETWLGQEGIEGGPIDDKGTLCIEGGGPSTIYEVEEIKDSDADEDEEELEFTQSQVASPKPQPTLMRQLSLLEWFRPQE